MSEHLVKAFNATNVLQQGLDRGSEGDSGTFHVALLSRTLALIVKDLRDDDDLLSLEEMQKANFPSSVLDEGVPNLANGGFILSFVGHHQIMDMTGQGVIMSLLSKAYRGEDLTQKKLAAGNLSRKNAIPLISGPLKETNRVQQQIAKTPTPKQEKAAMEGLPDPAAAQWAYFSFSATSLKKLKDLATSCMASQPTAHFQATPKVPYILTDDTLSAFVWRSITFVRPPHLEADFYTTFVRAIDVRPYLNLPAGYPG